MLLVHRPSDVRLRWSDEDRRIFSGANETCELWDEWLAAHCPDDEQIYRKLLLDLFVEYRNARHLGSDFSTVDSPYDEFNRCTGAPIVSMEDYVSRVRVLLDFEMNNRLTSPHDLAVAKVAFLVNGDPAAPPQISSPHGGDPVFFYRVDEPYGFLSNFAQYPVHVDGRVWPTSEHYFQACKFEGRPEQEQIRAAPTAREAARLGRTLPGIRKDWEVVKDEVMLLVLRAKFSQHAAIRARLLATGDRRLVEHTANDSYWADAGDGSGLNRLGELLMRVRAELRDAAQVPDRE